MATAKRAKVKAEPKMLELVCKCGDCSHWKIVLVRESKKAGDEYARSSEFIKCMSCGLEIGGYFNTGAHEGIHYERFDNKK